jgi:hypothetical protein
LGNFDSPPRRRRARRWFRRQGSRFADSFAVAMWHGPSCHLVREEAAPCRVAGLLPPVATGLPAAASATASLQMVALAMKSRARQVYPKHSELAGVWRRVGGGLKLAGRLLWTASLIRGRCRPRTYIRAVDEHYCPRPIVTGQIGQKFAPSCRDAHERLPRDAMRHPMFGAILIL